MAASHKRTVLSHPPLARIRPSGLYATLKTPSAWPSKAQLKVPAGASHRRMVSSHPLLARIRPSGLNDTPWTPILVTFQDIPKITRGHIPQMDSVVITAASQSLPVRAERHTNETCPELGRGSGG